MPLTDLELALKCEAAELAASRSRNAALPAETAARLGSGAMPLGAGQLCHNASDVLMFNMVLGLGIAAPAREQELDEALRIFGEHAVARCMVSLAPCARPAELAGWLETRDFRRHNHWVRLVRDVSPPPESRTDLLIAPFGREHAEVFGKLAGEAFGHPGILSPMLAAVVEREGWLHF